MLFGLLCVLAAAVLSVLVVAPTVKHVMKRGD